MRAFVTGGSGFVGRALIAALRAAGHPAPRALARSEAAARTVEAVGAAPVRGDLDDEAALRDGLAGCDVVFHAAAKADQWGTLEEFVRVNVGGTARVARAARAAGVRRMVHVSTEAVLVDGTPIRGADETRPRPPARRAIGLYPKTKGMAEEAALRESRDGLEVLVVRPRFVWGKGDTTLLPKFVEAVRTGKFAWIGGGRFPTSTCHVRNLCAGMLLAAERGRAGEIYFLTDGEPVEMRAFVTAMLRTQGVEPPERAVPYWLAYAIGCACELAWTVLPLRGAPPLTRTAVLLMGEEVTVSDAKARRELGYREVITREEGLRELAEAAAGAGGEAAPAP